MSEVDMVDVCERMAKNCKGMARTAFWGGSTMIVLGLLLFGLGIGAMLAVHLVYAVYVLLSVTTVGFGIWLMSSYKEFLNDVEDWKNRADWWRNRG